MNQLQYLAGAYFHQDYDLDAESPLALVEQYRDSEPPDDVAGLASEVEALLRFADEQSLRETWIKRYRASYEPIRDGMSYREWFERVLDVLREAR